MPKIKDYTDYREFLVDWSKFKVFENEFWTVSMWAKRLQIKSRSSLTMILKKQRHLSRKMLPKFINYFEFDDSETKYFTELVRINKSAKGDPRLTVLLLENSSSDIDQSQRDLVFYWQSYFLRELYNLKGYDPNPKWIQQRSREDISEEQIKTLRQRMCEEEFTYEDGKPKDSIRPKRDIAASDARKYHFELMELSKNAIDIPFDKRAFHASTLNIKKDRINEAKKLIREFQIQLSDLIEEVPGDDVYQFNMQFFPLTKS